MRCKNCGSENDDNLYICQNCGSPLYEEEDLTDAPAEEATQIFGALGGDDKDGDEADAKEEMRRMKAKQAEDKKKQTTALIIVLVVVLLAIIIGTIVAVVHAKSGKEDTTLSTVSITEEASTEATTRETTTQTTTETTTQTTTTTTTEVQKCTVSLTCNNGGEVEGDGKYEKGEEVTLIARPDDGYDFDGWYKGSTKVSGNTAYTFTIMDDTNLTAYFVIAEEDGGNADTINGDDDA